MFLILGLLKKKAKTLDEILTFPEGKRYYRDAHEVRKETLDSDALKVIHRLSKFGYKAYLVGGSIRDIVLGRHPKDFDIATTATPNQVRTVFSNSRIIGRRFKIVHINFRGKVVEVSTFRSFPDHRLDPSKSKKKDDIYLKRDNTYGTPKEDAARRDFTLNALFFDPRNEAIIDYVGGYQDLKKRVIRAIGDPDISFREDPVRMIRAAKFATLLDMSIERQTLAAIKRHRLELKKVNSSRLLEEYNKIFRTRKAHIIFERFHDLGMLDILVPEATKKARSKDFTSTPVGQRLRTADGLARERDQISTIVYLSILFSDYLDEFLHVTRDNNILQKVRSKMDKVLERMEIPRSQKEKIVRIFANYHKFHLPESEHRKLAAFFRKDFFADALLLFKIISMTDKDDAALNRVFQIEVEVGLSQAPAKTEGGNRAKRGRAGAKSGGRRAGSRPKAKAGDGEKSEKSDKSAGRGRRTSGGSKKRRPKKKSNRPAPSQRR